MENIDLKKIDSNNEQIIKIPALTGDQSLTLVFPKQFAVDLGIKKGDFLKCYLSEEKLIVEKMLK